MLTGPMRSIMIQADLEVDQKYFLVVLIFEETLILL